MGKQWYQRVVGVGSRRGSFKMTFQMTFQHFLQRVFKKIDLLIAFYQPPQIAAEGVEL